jgi:hypothetical protein
MKIVPSFFYKPVACFANELILKIALLRTPLLHSRLAGLFMPVFPGRCFNFTAL